MLIAVSVEDWRCRLSRVDSAARLAGGPLRDGATRLGVPGQDVDENWQKSAACRRR